jgi:hypothetical protein
MFNPQPVVQRLSLGGDAFCLVVDDALQDPQGLRNFALAQRARFAPARQDAYPGVELGLTGPIEQTLGQFFDRHIRALFGARRRLSTSCRLAMLTTAPDALSPRHWLPQRERGWSDERHLVLASVLYLFDDPVLGGTSFFRSRHNPAATGLLIHDSLTMPGRAFGAKYGLGPAYPSGTTRYFEHAGSAPARFNRLVFRDGRDFHGNEVGDARALGDDPGRNRLTLDGTYVCTRKAA